MNTLFDRTSIGNMKLRNRIFMSPMGTGTDPDGGFSEQSREYYEDRAEGGFGLVILGATTCTTKYEPKPCNVLDSQPMVERLQRVVESCHNYGAKVCLQISAGIGRMAFSDPSTPPYAASAVPGTYFPDVLCRPLSIEQIHDIEESFGNTAMWAKAAGCDSIMVQGYGGYLIDQFMCELWNKRDDEYGGSFENRMRFPLNLVKKVKEKCGEDFPVLFKFTLAHFIEGGRTVEEGLKVAKMLEEAGVAELHVDQGCFEVWYKPIPTVYDNFGTKLELTSKVKEVVNIPVSCDGKLDDPVVAMEAIASGKVDYVSLGKQSIADPQWPNKVKAGRFDDVRACIGCNDCLLGILRGRLVQCAVNPEVGYENFTQLKPNTSGEKQNILIVGAGIGGMEAAITAARRGFDVTVWEKEAKAGGLGNAAAAPYMKQSVRNYVKYLDNQIKKHADKITVVYNKVATPENVKQFNPDKIVVATGATSLIPRIPGLQDNPKVGSATQYLLGKYHAEGKVVVIGAGLVGCETALDLAHKGSSLTVVEMLDQIVAKDDINDNNKMKLNQLIAEAGLDMRFNTQAKSVTETEIVLVNEGKEIRIPYDYILVAAGMRANDGLAQELYDSFDNVYLIGDACKPGRIMEAVHQGYAVANNMF
ncbi:MAG: NAD(P)/FAD-dependent oxidoreductase [Anaerovoracaceae bacterium]